MTLQVMQHKPAALMSLSKKVKMQKIMSQFKIPKVLCFIQKFNKPLLLVLLAGT